MLVLGVPGKLFPFPQQATLSEKVTFLMGKYIPLTNSFPNVVKDKSNIRILRQNFKYLKFNIWIFWPPKMSFLWLNLTQQSFLILAGYISAFYKPFGYAENKTMFGYSVPQCLEGTTYPAALRENDSFPFMTLVLRVSIFKLTSNLWASSLSICRFLRICT